MVVWQMRGRSIAALGALALLACISSIPAATASAATTPPGPRLGFFRLEARGSGVGFGTVGLGGDFLEAPGSGSGPRLVPSVLSGSSWLPDGSGFVYSGSARQRGRDEGNAQSRTELLSLPAAGGVPTAIPNTEGGIYPVVFPDGRTVAFLRVKGTNSGSNSVGPNGKRHLHRTRARSSVWLVGIDGSAPRRLTPWRKTPDVEIPSSVSTDGQHLVVTREQLGPEEHEQNTFLLDIESGRSTGRIEGGGDAVYSPDGTRVAFIFFHPFAKPHVLGGKGATGRTTIFGRSALVVVDLATESITQIASGGVRPVADPSWDPSGQRLSFLRYANVGSESGLFGLGDTVMEANPDGSCLTAVLHSPGVAYLAPAWQPGAGRGAGPIAC